jgi:hypothetical protein
MHIAARTPGPILRARQTLEEIALKRSDAKEMRRDLEKGQVEPVR